MESARIPVLLVDDDLSLRETIRAILATRAEVVEAACCEEALRLLESGGRALEVVLLDIGFGAGRMQGHELLPLIRTRWPHLEVIMISVENDVPTAVRCIKLGAFDYVTKGSEMVATLPTKIAQAVTLITVRRENEMLRWELERRTQVERTLAQGGPEAPIVRALPAEIVRPFEDVTKDYFLHALKVCGGNMAEAARRLQIPYNSFRQRLIALDLVDAARS